MLQKIIQQYCRFLSFLIVVALALMVVLVFTNVFQGTLAQVRINRDSTSAAMEVSMAIFYGCGLVFAVSAAVILLNELWRLVTGQLNESGLAIRESDAMPLGDPKPWP